jgi:2-dehydropantoate 2-reductase
MRTIFIIGSGTIGRALALFLKLAGRNVVLVRGSVNDSSRKTERIRVELANGSIQETDMEIATLSAFDSLDGIIVLANKSYGNEQLSLALNHKTGHSPIVFLQNGLNVEQPFIDKGFPEIYRCVLFVTSQFVDTATVRFKPVAVCPIGVISGDHMGLTQVVELLSVPDFQFRKEDDIKTVTWKKAIINCVFNSVCPLLDTDNGIFHRDDTALHIARRVLMECIAIAGAKGVHLDPAEVEQSLLQISRSSDGQLISTLQDIRNKRRTEIETLNFEIVKIARSLGREDAVKETRLLGELTKLKADLNDHL